MRTLRNTSWNQSTSPLKGALAVYLIKAVFCSLGEMSPVPSTVSPVCSALGIFDVNILKKGPSSPVEGKPTKPVTLDLVLAAPDLTADGHGFLFVLLPLGFNGGGG